jgi:predicted  nucleic acid-binding Zn-ribbon protein
MATAKELTPIVTKLEKDLEHLQTENLQLFKNYESANKDIKRLRKQMDEKSAALEALRREIEEMKKGEKPKLLPDIEAQVKNLMSKEVILQGMKEEIVPMTKQQRAAQIYKQYKAKQNGNTNQ